MLKTGQYEKLHQLLSKKKKDDMLMYYRGLAFAKQEKYIEAIDILKPVIEGNPDHANSRKLAFNLLLNQATMALNNNSQDEFARVLSNAIDITPDDAESQKKLQIFKSALPISLMLTGKRDEAAEFWELQLKKKPDDFILIHSLALLYYWSALEEEEKIKNSSQSKPDPKLETNDNIANGISISSENKSVDSLWEKVIMYWVLLINTQEFWDWWKKEKESTWGQKIINQDIQELKNDLNNEKLRNTFINYFDFYKQNSDSRNTLRFEYILGSFIARN